MAAGFRRFHGNGDALDAGAFHKIQNINDRTMRGVARAGM